MIYYLVWVYTYADGFFQKVSFHTVYTVRAIAKLNQSLQASA